MRKRERELFKKMLVERRQRVSGDFGELVDEARRESETEVSSDDHAEGGSESFEKEVSFNLMELERTELLEIDEALARLEKNTYGICQGCEGVIQIPRLRAKPYARYCIECKRVLEEGGQKA